MLTSACMGLVFIGLYAQIGVGSQKLALEADSQKVGKYEKIEFMIHLETKYGNPYKELIHFHNSLWASALSGLSGTALFWWWEQLDTMDAYHHYQPLSAFLADVPFTTANLHHASVRVSGDQVRVVGLQGSNCAYLWLSNSQAKWSNQVIDNQKPDVVMGAKLNIGGLLPGSYQIQWWDTYEGKIVEQKDILLSGQTLSIMIPDFPRDIACKVTNQSI